LKRPPEKADDNVIRLQEHSSELEAGIDPVALAESLTPAAFVHSTSWRWSPDGVILTFAHVLPEGGEHTQTDSRVFTVDELEQHPVACHAVRHLHFLLHTNPGVAELSGMRTFWAYVEAVVTKHHPAVAGLLVSTETGSSATDQHGHDWSHLAIGAASNLAEQT